MAAARLSKMVALSGAFLFLESAMAWAACPPNADRWFFQDAPRCRCTAGYIVNKGICVLLNDDSAKVRAIELKREKRSACHAMAQIYNEISYAVSFSIIPLVNYTGRILSDGIPTIIDPVMPDYAVSFDDSGFRIQYRQPGHNQVRHFVGYFGLGVNSPHWTVDEIITHFREIGDAEEDITLGKAAAALGKYMRSDANRLKHVGRAIRSEICE